MAKIGQKYFDLIDYYKSLDANGTTADVIEMLMQFNPVLEDAIAVECNNGTKHKTVIRTGLPEVSFGKLYGGMKQSKSSKQSVEDTTGFIEGLSTVDERLLELAGKNKGAIRLQEAESFLQSISNTIAQKIFYGSTVGSPEEFMGLAPRFNDPSAQNGKQIIDGGGLGADNASIWMVTWGENQVHTLYPKGTKAGINRQDMGRQRVYDENNDPYYAYEEKFTQHMGISVKDWRYVTRVANIDVSEALAGNVDLFGLLRKAYYQNEGRRHMKGHSKGMKMGRMAIYCNSDILEALDMLGTNAGANDNFIRLKPAEIEGKECQTYRSIPVRETDALLSTEELVPFA